MANIRECLHAMGASPEALDQFDAILAKADYDLATETVTSGALSVARRTSYLSIDGTKAFTLADGTVVGQVKSLVCTVAANTPAGTVTPANMIGGTTLSFNDVGDSATLVWSGSDWIISATNSVTVG